MMAKKIGEAAHQRRDEEIEPVIEFADRLDPEHIAERLMILGEACDAVSLIAADHPLVRSPISPLRTAPATSGPTTGNSVGQPLGSSLKPPARRDG